MSEQRWIVFPGWERFQHRDAARSNVPTWIKDFTEQLSKDEYLDLTWQQRGLLHDLRLEYARAKRQLSASTTSLSRRLGQTVRFSQLEALSDAGFIELSASKPARADARKDASLEVEVEVKSKDLVLRTEESEGARFAAQVIADTREHHPYDPPLDPVAVISRQIRLGVITDRIELDAELAALRVNGDTAASLVALLEAGS